MLCGPTATGKTETAVALAKRVDGEVISADSMQIYAGLSVGTARATPEEMDGVPHHLVGFVSPETRFSVAEYVRLAAACIADIQARGRVPIAAGGTGLYLSSLVNGIDYFEEDRDDALRRRLARQLEQEGEQAMYDRLCARDPAYAKTLHPADHVRVLRALEWCEKTGETMTCRLARSRPAQRPWRPLLVGLNPPERAQLYARIDARVDRMLARGLLDEARRVYENRDRYQTAAQAIGYKEFFPYFDGAAPLEACVDALKRASRRYAKRQLTWFRHMEGIVWLPQTGEAAAREIARMWEAGGAPPAQ